MKAKEAEALYEKDHARYFRELGKMGRTPHEYERIYAGWRAWYDGYRAAQRAARKTSR